MSRRKAREVALQVLYQLDFNKITVTEALENIFGENSDLSPKARAYAQEVVSGTSVNLDGIDKVIAQASIEWKLERMASVDRNIVRIAVYEMFFAAERLTPNVAINEAIEVAKKFGSEESGRFVNGILGSLVKRWLKEK